MFKELTAVIAIAVLAGCVGDPYRSAVESFGVTTATAVKIQRERLDTFAAYDEERARAGLAAQNAVLKPSEGCLNLLMDEGRPGDCVVVGPDGEPANAPIEADNIVALGAALENYSASLGALAADAKEDREAFAKATSDFAVAVGKLDAAFAKAAETEPRTDERLGSFATIIAETANLYFDYQRSAALKRIVVDTDPLVQDATALLSSTHIVLRTGLLTNSFDKVDTAARATREAIETGQSNDKVREKHDALFEAVSEHREIAGVPNTFAAVGSAHAALKQAALSGASAADFEAALHRIIEAGAGIGGAVEQINNHQET